MGVDILKETSLSQPEENGDGLGEFEGRMFQFFATRTASELDGDFEDDFWRKVVLQVSQRVPFVRHAVLALTCLHTIHCMKQPTFPAILPADPIDLRQQATYHYSRAIQLLNHHISTNRWASLEETLLCCVLCIRFEWVAGNRTAALVHLRSSLQILREWQALPPSTSPAPTSFWSPGGYLIRFTISPLYVRIALEASMFADVEEAVPVPLKPPSPLGSQPFASLSEARDSLYEILGDEYLFRHQGTSQKKKPGRHGKLSAIERFNHWSLCAAALLLKFDDQDRESTPPVIVLRIWLKVVRIMLEAKGRNDECIFDRYSDDFSAAVDLASIMYSLKTSSFTADTSIVAVLYYVAAKCRHPTTRRRAIALLERCPRQEGIWNSATAARLATYIVEQEEEAAGQPVYTEADVPRAARMSGWDLRGQSQGVFNFQVQSEGTESTCSSKKDLGPRRISMPPRVE
ncbi:hypothetical protein S40288_04693 [Stachybotrys chartarum IBT 40288]|nr:hypothetical protein S40288_04693 [Stachybotrys chartarum IBT 40288]